MAGARRALILATDDYTDAGLADLSAPELDAAQLRQVLEDPAIGGFEVTTLLNEPEPDVRRGVARFLKANSTDDLLIHVTCHGVKAPDGQLYLATTDTDLSLLSATAVPAAFLNAAMEESRARSILLLLDCCYAGAFAKGMSAKAGGPVDVDARLGGSGRAVVTATDALQFAFEGGDLVQGDPGARPSIFTDVVVQGLRTGEADLDQDGRVTLREFFDYVDDEVRRRHPDQTPRLFIHDVSGDLFIAGRTTPATKPTPLSPKVQQAVESEDYWTRVGIVSTLLDLARGDHPGRALAARQALEELSADPDDRVKQEARQALRTLGEPEPEPEFGPGPTPGPTPEPGPGPMPDPEPGPSPGPGPGPTPGPGPQPHPPPPAWWRRTEVRAVAGVVVVLAAVAALWSQLPVGDDPGPDPGPEPTRTDVTTTAPPAERLADSVVLLTRQTEGGRELVAVDLADGNSVTPLDGGEDYERPTISPDRRWVVAMRQEGPTPAQSVPYLGGSPDEARPLLGDEASDGCPYTTRPSWNPSSSQLALICQRADGSGKRLVVVDRDGRLVRELFAGRGLTESPTWGGDGRVYFPREARNGTTSAWSVPEGGGDAVQVEGLPTDTKVSHLDWAPTGLLYLESDPDGSDSYVWTLPWGSEPLQISWDGAAGSPAWSPDGRGALWLNGDRLVVKTSMDASETVVEVGAGLGPPAWGSR